MVFWSEAESCRRISVWLSLSGSMAEAEEEEEEVGLLWAVLGQVV